MKPIAIYRQVVETAMLENQVWSLKHAFSTADKYPVLLYTITIFNHLEAHLPTI